MKKRRSKPPNINRSQRKKILPNIEAAVLGKSARRCVLCFHLNGDLAEKKGQIAHLDGDRSNRDEDNLAWMCLDHHSTYDSSTSQHKNYTIREVKTARAKLYALVAEGKHLTPDAALPYAQVEADKRILHDFLKLVPSNGAIKFLRTNNFGFSFDTLDLEDIERFFYDRNGPDHEFLDGELESKRQNFRNSCKTFLTAVALNTFPARTGERQTVPDEWEIGDPKRFHEAVDELHRAADAICSTYDEMVRLARRKLPV